MSLVLSWTCTRLKTISKFVVFSKWFLLLFRDERLTQLTSMHS